jgi:hypothetical protein
VVTYRQLYWPDSNILVTCFLSLAGDAETVDFMTVGASNNLYAASAVRGEVTFRAFCQLAVNYARDPHVVKLTAEGAVFCSRNVSLTLATLLPLQQNGEGVTADFSLREGETASFILASLASDDAVRPRPSEGEIEGLFSSHCRLLAALVSKCSYQDRWREMVQRPALALKLLRSRQPRLSSQRSPAA